MPTKPPYLKTPMQLWVMEGIAELARVRDVDMKAAVAIVAEAAEVREATAAGWRSRGRVPDDKREVLARLFGKRPPDDAPMAYVDQVALVAALKAQTEAITALVGEMQAVRLDRDRFEALERAVERLVGDDPTEPTGEASPEQPSPHDSAE